MGAIKSRKGRESAFQDPVPDSAPGGPEREQRSGKLKLPPGRGSLSVSPTNRDLGSFGHDGVDRG